MKPCAGRLWFCAAIVGMLGCRSVGPSAPATARAFPTEVRRSGVAVEAVTYFTAEHSREILGTDVSEEFMPVLVTIANEGKGSVLLDIEGTSLVSSDGVVSRLVAADDAIGEYDLGVPGEVGRPAGAAIVIGIARAAVTAHNEGLSARWSGKAMRSNMFVSGDSRQGLLFFSRNTGRPPYALRVVLDRLDPPERVDLWLSPLEVRELEPAPLPPLPASTDSYDGF